MKKPFPYALCFVLSLLISCNKNKEGHQFHQPDWANRKITAHSLDSLKKRISYLPVYAQIYEISEERKINLAATVSIRNTDTHDSIFISRVDYYNTEGHLIRNYVTDPIYVKPMETLEIVIKSADNAGGTGANFLFEWYSKSPAPSALFESVMISTTAQQGISFTSRAVEIGQ